VAEARNKVLSLRLSEEMAAEIAAVARTDGMPVTEAIREAIANHIDARRASEDFRQRLRKRLEEDQKVLKSLARERP
jgi:predicted DNA-binding protein